MTRTTSQRRSRRTAETVDGGAGAEPAWLGRRRKRASELLEELSFPGPKTPGWEFTDISDIPINDLSPLAEGESTGTTTPAHAWIDAPPDAVSIDQTDGAITGAPTMLSQSADKPAGPTVMSLCRAAELFPDLVAKHAGSIARQDDPLVVGNDAAWCGGAFVYVPAGTVAASPIVLNTTQSADGRALYRRTLIVLEEGAQAEVWERYASANPNATTLLNTVSEVIVGPGAVLRYVCEQALNEKSWVLGTQRASIDRGGSLHWAALGFGSAKGRIRMETELAGRGAQANVIGVCASRNVQHLDYDTTQEHTAVNTTSNLAFRGLLGGRSRSVWRGMIDVAPGAQKTDAFQESRSMLLSKDTNADAIPGLQIQADDVRCTHAAAVQRIDAEQLFYLKSRGVHAEAAKNLIVDGFLAELPTRFATGWIHKSLQSAVQRRIDAVLDTRTP